jgi:hypothetical protein
MNDLLLPQQEVLHIPKRRRSSLIDRWIQDQQSHSPVATDTPANSESLPSIGTKCNPYLAYPQMSRYSINTEVGSLHSYDVVDHDELLEQRVQLDAEVRVLDTLDTIFILTRGACSRRRRRLLYHRPLLNHRPERKALLPVTFVYLFARPPHPHPAPRLQLY